MVKLEVKNIKRLIIWDGGSTPYHIIFFNLFMDWKMSKGAFGSLHFGEIKIYLMD
jgi:hypothetical protein